MRTTGVPVSWLLAVALLGACPLVWSQDLNYKPKSPTPDALPGNQLIVWSETQKPHPVPASSPEMYRENGGTQIVNGTILTEGSELVFATDRVVYDIANQAQVTGFVGKNVQVGGVLAPKAHTLRVLNIEALK